jgi:hypothetical protein
MIVPLGGDQYRCDICGLVITTTTLPITCCTRARPQLTDAQRDEAAQKLDLLPGPIPAQLMGRLAAWVAAGMPLRLNWQELWRAPCEHRRASGMCGKLGCASEQKGYHVACVWLCKIETASCPAGMWPRVEVPNGQAIPPKLLIPAITAVSADGRGP